MLCEISVVDKTCSTTFARCSVLSAQCSLTWLTLHWLLQCYPQPLVFYWQMHGFLISGFILIVLNNLLQFDGDKRRDKTYFTCSTLSFRLNSNTTGLHWVPIGKDDIVCVVLVNEDLLSSYILYLKNYIQSFAHLTESNGLD